MLSDSVLRININVFIITPLSSDIVKYVGAHKTLVDLSMHSVYTACLFNCLLSKKTVISLSKTW